MKIEVTEFGHTKDGSAVEAYRITNSHGAYVTVLNYGAIVKDIAVPDKDGHITDVVLGYDTLDKYETNPNFFGACIGRSGNRIANSTFTIDGREYHLTENEGHNNLHSGPDGFEKRIWKAVPQERNGCVSFSLVSPDGDQGFPGNFKVTVTYMLTEQNKFKIHYEGISDADTVANMTNHSYFNLNGEGSGSILDHSVLIHADGYTPVGEGLIPVGSVAPVAGTPFDFREMKKIGRDIAANGNEQLALAGGFDHNFALNGEGLRNVAEAVGDRSGIVMTVMTDQPGMQFYAGNYISGPAGKHSHEYKPRDGFAMETQHFPNSVNTPAFESPIIAAGAKYSTTTCYTFGTEQ